MTEFLIGMLTLLVVGGIVALVFGRDRTDYEDLAREGRGEEKDA